MIRPLTIATFLLACGSGLYLYQSKHEVQVLDRTIERTVNETRAIREQARLLAAEWTMLNDPDRLRQFSDTYLQLKPIAPPQFASLGDLAARLPAVQAPPPRVEAPRAPDAAEPPPDRTEAPAQPQQRAAAGTQDTDPLLASEDTDLPLPPLPPPQAFAAAPRPPERRLAAAKPAEAPRALPETRPPEQRGPEQRVAEQRTQDQRPPDLRPDPRAQDPRAQDPRAQDPRSAPPRALAALQPRSPANGPPSNGPQPYAPQPSYSPPPQPLQPPSQGQAPYSGSLLGMARPSPRPAPVNWSNPN
jgi:hypothetical protein